jgi:hypothetical protein
MQGAGTAGDKELSTLLGKTTPVLAPGRVLALTDAPLHVPAQAYVAAAVCAAAAAV